MVTFESMPTGLRQALNLADELMYGVKARGKGNVHRGVLKDDRMTAGVFTANGSIERPPSNCYDLDEVV
jgi:hypothetical protein